MQTMVLGVFSDRGRAEDAITELEGAGYSTKDISIIMKDKVEAAKIVDNTGANVAGGAISGATAGGVVGAIAGLLVGIGAIAIPGIGAVLIGGPIAVALGLSGAAAVTASGAVTGAVAGGLVGGLMGLGLPEKEAVEYEKEIKAGAILVAIPTRTENDDVAADVLTSHGATQVRSIPMKFEK